MREYSVPEVVNEPGPELNMTDAVYRNAEQAPDTAVFSRRANDGWRPVTALTFAQEVSELAAGLIATGLEPGDRIGLMSRTRYEWTLLDYAIWAAGGVTVPIYETSSSEQIQWILSDSGAKAAFLETTEHQSVFEKIAADLPEVSHHWLIDNEGLDALRTAGRGVDPATLAARRRSRGAADVATIVYTSGTTGRPKGCELTHFNMWSTASSAAKVLPQLFNPAGSTLLFLPLAHVFGRLIQGACVENRVRMGHTYDIKNLLRDFAAFQPTFILSVPRIFEKVYNTAKQRAHADGKGAIFDRAEKTAIAYSEGLTGGTPGALIKLEHAVFDRLVYRKLRAAMGGHVAYAVSGGAPLGARLGHFFRGIGITVLEGYGLTETTAAGTVNTVDHIKIGTVGRPSPGCTVKIAESDGEILMKGRHVFGGYWRNEQSSADVLVAGWFHTGDVGELDSEGFLKITGRKKELLVTAGGKNVAPAPMEDRIRAHPLISQAMVIGDNKPFIAALVTLDADAIGPWRSAHGKPANPTAADLVDDPDLRAAVQGAIDEANNAVSKAESIRTFTILPEDFSEVDGTLTPSLKVKRNVVMQNYSGAVNEIYKT
ncbi:MAG TPA: AMP-binding protein [Mycobacteriales bacterium]|nr:AMP-binding protein [Mycobacteriales bacterium]